MQALLTEKKKKKSDETYLSLPVAVTELEAQ